MLNNESIERVQNFDFLGIMLNENLSWKSHIHKIANKIARNNGILNKLKHFLLRHVLHILYYSMIHCHLNYSILNWGNETNRLVKLQKKSIRILAGARHNAHSEPLFKKFKILNIRDLLYLNTLKFYYKLCNNKLPSYFLTYKLEPQLRIHDHFTRGNNIIPGNITRTKFAQLSLRNKLPTIINKTNKSILEKVHTHSLNGFSEYIKNKILNDYNTECNVVNCYVCHNN